MQVSLPFVPLVFERTHYGWRCTKCGFKCHGLNQNDIDWHYLKCPKIGVSDAS